MSKNRIDITEQEAIDLKENITEEEKDLLKNAVKKEIRKKHRKKTKYMKAAAVRVRAVAFSCNRKFCWITGYTNI